MDIAKLRKKCQIDTDKSPYKHVSIYLTAIFLKLGISANQAMILEILVTVFGGLIILTFPISYYWIIAALLFYLGDILDKVNGEIARYYGVSSPAGTYLDGLFDTLKLALIITFISYGIFIASGNILNIVLGYLVMLSLFIYNFSEKSAFLIFNKNGKIASFGAYDDPGTRNVKGIKKVGLLSATAFVRNTALLICTILDVFFWDLLPVSFITLWLFTYSMIFMGGATLRAYECMKYVAKLEASKD